MIKDIKSFCVEADKRKDRYESRGMRYWYYIQCVQELLNKYLISKYAINLKEYDILKDIQLQQERQAEHMKRVRNIEKSGSYLLAVNEMLTQGILSHEPDWRRYTPAFNNMHVNDVGRAYVSRQALRYGMMKYLNISNPPVKRIVDELRENQILVTYEKSRDLTKIHNGKHYYELDIEALKEYCSVYDEREMIS